MKICILDSRLLVFYFKDSDLEKLKKFTEPIILEKQIFFPNMYTMASNVALTNANGFASTNLLSSNGIGNAAMASSVNANNS